MNIAATSPSLASASNALVPCVSGRQGWLARAGAAVWRAFEESGRARARFELADFADRCEALQPELAKELRSAIRHDPLV